MAEITEEIPREELNRFKDHMRTYPKGARIIAEGVVDDNSLYLLRRGRVAVCRNVGQELKRISAIEAVNFFGEMALIVGGARSATILADSNDVLVYQFHTPDLQTIISNPSWGETLVTRLCQDVKQADAQIVSYAVEVAELKKANQRMVADAALLLAGFEEILNGSANEVILHSREWRFFVALGEMMKRYLNTLLPQIAVKTREYEGTALERIRHERLLPESLNGLIHRDPS